MSHLLSVFQQHPRASGRDLPSAFMTTSKYRARQQSGQPQSFARLKSVPSPPWEWSLQPHAGKAGVGRSVPPGRSCPCFYQQYNILRIFKNIFSGATDRAVLERQEGNHLPALLQFQVWGVFKHILKIPCCWLKQSTCWNALLSRGGLKDIHSFRHVLNCFVKLNWR